LEAVVFGFRHHLDVLAELGHRPGRIVATDGGARSALWRQIAADVLQLPVMYQAHHPGSALGAAFAAGIGSGVIHDWRAIRGYAEVTQTTQPRPALAAGYDHLYGIYRDLYPALRPSFAALADTPDQRQGR
jgi:xylulokinase